MQLINTHSKFYRIKTITKPSKYKISFYIDGVFHIKFAKIDAYDNVVKYYTRSIYSDAGEYSYVLPLDEGTLAIEVSSDRENAWSQILNLAIIEV